HKSPLMTNFQTLEAKELRLISEGLCLLCRLTAYRSRGKLKCEHRPPDSGAAFFNWKRDYDYVCGAWNLCTGKRRIRQGRRCLSFDEGGRALSRLRGGCCRQRAGPCASSSRSRADRTSQEALA